MIIEGGFKADSIIIDGYDFNGMTKECIKSVKDFAIEMGVAVWYSCSVKDAPSGGSYNKENIPVVISDFIDNIDIVIVLQPKTDYVELSISKDRGSIISQICNANQSIAMKLDPKTLLILEK